MNSEDKALTIIAAIFIGVIGSVIIGWPAAALSAVSIYAVSQSNGDNDDEQG